MVSTSEQVAPPCSNPKGCWLPSTGIVATSRSGLKSVIWMPSLSSSGLIAPAGAQAGGGVLTQGTVTSPSRGHAGVSPDGPRIDSDVRSRHRPRVHLRSGQLGAPSAAAAAGRSLPRLPRVLRAAGGELLDDDGP